MGSQQLYSLSWGEFGSSLTSTVRTLRNHNDMVDVTLAAGGKIFPAHKLVLSAASPLLMELLKSTNCHHPVLMLAGITAPDLEALLQFVYQGEVSVDSTQLPSLLQAAHCLNIQALSPQTLTTEKTMAQVSVPFVITESVRDINLHRITPSRDLNMTPQTQPPQDLTPLMPVRKRKRKQSQSSETESMKWRLSDSAGSSTVETQQLEQVNSNHSEDTKDGIMDDQHSNGETAVKRIVSDLPVECTVCGVTLRQSRNLRRHMELIHLKAENGGVKLRKGQYMVKDETKKIEEEGLQSVQTMTEPVLNLVEQSSVPSRQVAQPSSSSTTHLTLPSTTNLHTSSSNTQLLVSQSTTHLLDPLFTTQLTPPSTLHGNPPPTTHLKSPPPTTHLLNPSLTTHLKGPVTTHVNPSSTTHLLNPSLTTHLTSPSTIHHNPVSTTHLKSPPPTTHLLNPSLTTHLTSPSTTLHNPVSTTHLKSPPPTTHLLNPSLTTHLKSPPTTHVNPSPTTQLTSSPLTTHLLNPSFTTYLTSPPTTQLTSHPSNTHLLTSTPIYHSSVQCDPYPPTQTHSHTHTVQFTHDMYRQQHSDILRSAGLYADTREHCAPE